MSVSRNIDSLTERYGDPLAALDRVPRSASELYRRWAGMPEEAPLTTRHRNGRRTLARYLNHLAKREIVINGRRVVQRAITDEDHQTHIAFWCEVVSDATLEDTGRGPERAPRPSNRAS